VEFSSDLAGDRTTEILEGIVRPILVYGKCSSVPPRKAVIAGREERSIRVNDFSGPTDSIEFFGASDPMTKSQICPKFPNKMGPYPNRAGSNGYAKILPTPRDVHQNARTGSIPTVGLQAQEYRLRLKRPKSAFCNSFVSSNL